MIEALRTRVGRAPGFAWAVLGCVTLALGMVYLLIRPSPLLGIALALLVAGLLVPKWVLLGGAVVFLFVYPEIKLAGDVVPSDLLVGMYLARQVAAMFLAPPASLFGDREVRWLLAFLLWTWFGLVVVQSWDTATAFGRITLYAAVFLAAAHDKKLGPPLLRFFALFALYEAVLGLTGVTPRLDNRLLGHYGDPHQFGLLMLVGLAGTLVMRRSSRMVIFPILLFASVLTLTRGIWVATFIALLVGLVPFLGRRKILLLASVCVMIVVFLAIEPFLTQELNLNAKSQEYRVLTADTGIEAIKDHPILGVGWAVGTLKLPEGIQPPYNLWVNLGASTGIPGVIMFTVFLALLARQLGMSRNPVARAGLVFLTGVVVLSLSEMLLYAVAPASLTLFIVTGAGLAWARGAHEEEQVEADPSENGFGNGSGNGSSPEPDPARGIEATISLGERPVGAR